MGKRGCFATTDFFSRAAGRTFAFLLVSLCALLFSACDLLFEDDDFKDELASVYSTEYTFYASDESGSSHVTLSYRIGTVQDFTDSELSQMKGFSGGYPFIGWEYAFADVPSNISLDEDEFVRSATVTPKRATFYAVHGVSYTVVHRLQNVDRTTYTDKDEQTKFGVPGKSTKAYARSYTGFSAPSVTQETIASDGSTRVVIDYDRAMYYLTLDANGGDMSDVQGMYYGVPTAIRAHSCARTGYTFSGWASSASGAAAYADGADYTIGAADATLYAAWTPSSYSVTLSAPDADSQGTSSVTATFGSTLPAVTVPYREGYTFTGYNSESDGSGFLYYGSAGRGNRAWDIPADTTLYAMWSPRTDTVYTVRHLTQPVSMSTATADYELVSSATQTLRGTTGESTAATTRALPGFEARPVTQQIIARDGGTVVDIYYDRALFSLTLDANGGDNAGVTASSIGMYYGVPTAIPANQFARTGYSFMGWATGTSRAAAGTVDYEDGADYAIGAADATLYAVWKSNIISITVGVADSYETGIRYSQSGNIVTLTAVLPDGAAEGDYTYQWFITREGPMGTGLGTGRTCTVDTSEWTRGSYEISLFATKAASSGLSAEYPALSGATVQIVVGD